MSRILAIDETPGKAGRKEKGKLKQVYYWPIMGEADEICFTFSESRIPNPEVSSIFFICWVILMGPY